MTSPPSSHPFLRPAVAVASAASGSLDGQQRRASYGFTGAYQSMLTPVTGSEDTSFARPTSPASAAATSSRGPSPRPPSTTRTPFDTTMNGSAEPFADPSESPRKLSRWEEKVQGDLAGWRGGEGVPQAGVPNETYYGQPPTGVVGRDLPKEIVRIERDWSLGDICQFATAFPLELESRLSPASFQLFVEAINDPLREAYSTSGAVIDNIIAIVTWWTSLIWRTSHFEKELQRAEEVIRMANETTFNRVGLNILSPREVALQYLEIEYY
ncbi:uncharacterized protein EHS24_003990 [Apiotrichum porosum]|uniref:Ras modification protein ERF4 n=1 Tax=Apiotrichum porosum TaxID=105984 RepID=A0A427Y403_9TREE|nr:uncharacterized protein EHS24_003990 [Apiotrichum porosum]RSH85810.1 hypothetical protein EHS24_003990 [Apiotrichum porosum]